MAFCKRPFASFCVVICNLLLASADASQLNPPTITYFRGKLGNLGFLILAQDEYIGLCLFFYPLQS
jgi:hypothetical protein